MSDTPDSLLAPWRGLPTLAVASAISLLALVTAHLSCWLMGHAERLQAIGNAARPAPEDA
jgi:hypothetical protein